MHQLLPYMDSVPKREHGLMLARRGAARPSPLKAAARLHTLHHFKMGTAPGWIGRASLQGSPETRDMLLRG